jgi:hypothetical protein
MTNACTGTGSGSAPADHRRVIGCHDSAVPNAAPAASAPADDVRDPLLRATRSYLHVTDVHSRLARIVRGATRRAPELGRRLDVLLTLHRPHLELYGDTGRVVCRGCGEVGDPEPPAWPCRTWAVLADPDTHTAVMLALGQ